MPKNSINNIISEQPDSTRRRVLRRYQLAWNPSFYGSNSSVYVLGEDLAYGLNSERSSTSFSSVQDILDLGLTNGIVLPLNTNIALAQEYAPSIKNKIVSYETVGGNSVTSFGEAIRVIGMRIRIIKLSEAWRTYYKGLEALSIMSGDQARYYGGLYLTGYDSFSGSREIAEVSYRYKVTISSLDFNFKSDVNTSITADLQLIVNQDLTRRRTVWGQL